MADFSYKAANASGRVVQGQIEAKSREDALRRLVYQGLTPVAIFDSAVGEAPAKANGKPAGGLHFRLGPDSVKRADVMAFTSELAVMMRAGLPLDNALRILLGMEQRPSVEKLLSEILAAVKGGVPLSRALAGYPGLFGSFYVNMVRSGEASGKLGAVLTRLVEHLERMRELRDSVTSALIYPAILMVIAVFSVVGILVFVVPQFESLFHDAKQALPIATSVMLAASRFTISNGLYLLAGLVLTGALAWRWMRTSSGQRWRQSLLSRMPLLGAIRHEYNIARFARTFGTLLSNGVPILTALEIAAETVDDELMRESIKTAAPKVKSGSRLADALQATGRFKPLGINLVRVGEETGSLDKMVLEMASILDRKIEIAIKRGLTLLEPVLILILGVFVAGMIVSLLLGILAMNDLAV
jgi:general secretion pathway protein F